MLKEELSINRIAILPSVKNWEEAVKESVKLLEKDGVVPASYKDEIISSVNELGPYIFIAPDIALPHVQMFGETKVGVSLLKLNESVSYDEERSAFLFFAFSAEDGNSHIGLIQELATFLSDDNHISDLKEKNTVGEIFEYIQRNG